MDPPPVFDIWKPAFFFLAVVSLLMWIGIALIFTRALG